MKIDCLDHGYVLLVETMGSDQAIADSARVSYASGTKKVHNDEGLIRYLLRNWHTSPFEQCALRFEVSMPIFVARQWLRHRMFNTNEMSARYSVLPSEFYIPAPERMKTQSSINNQGSSEDLIRNPERAVEIIDELSRYCYEKYEELLDMDLSRELARIVLPVNIYTKIVWKGDLLNLMKFLKLRMDSHAQEEIRIYAEALSECVKAHFPIAYQAFEDYIKHSLNFSRTELDSLRSRKLSEEMSKREQREFFEKLDLIGISQDEFN